MIASVFGGLFLWFLIGVIVFCRQMMIDRAGPGAGCLLTLLLIVGWPLRLLGIFK